MNNIRLTLTVVSAALVIAPVAKADPTPIPPGDPNRDSMFLRILTQYGIDRDPDVLVKDAQIVCKVARSG
jgi:hypothetical protein